LNSFYNVGGLRPSKSFFNLSYKKKFNCDMGQLIPVMCDEVVPGDIVKIGNDVVVRFEPMVAPVMDDIWLKVRYFFVPYRLLHRDCLSGDGVEPGDTFDWETFITGGKEGDGKDKAGVLQVLPLWSPTNNAKYSLWDYLGFPVGVTPTGMLPLNFPREAYNFIYNEYFINENIDSEVSLDNESILNVRWNKDYFTSCLPWQQRGVAPVLAGDIMYLGSDDDYHSLNMASIYSDSSGTTGKLMLYPAQSYGALVKSDDGVGYQNLQVAAKSDVAPKGGVSPVVFGGFNVAQLRLCVQTQKWLERNARAGARYTEFLKAHYGVAPTDARLDRPEYIGGCKTPIIVSEVLQTSNTVVTGDPGEETVHPQGGMAGHGISIDRNYVAKYRVQEFGLIMGLAYIVPKHGYSGQGINRQWLRRAKLEFYTPEFAHISEQGVYTAEIFASSTEATNKRIFGFIGAFDEMRHKQDMVAADFRDVYQYWTLNDQYENAPLLNSSFVECNPRKNIFAVETFPGCKVNFQNIIHAYRPLPLIGEPGLVDHY